MKVLKNKLESRYNEIKSRYYDFRNYNLQNILSCINDFLSRWYFLPREFDFSSRNNFLCCNNDISYLVLTTIYLIII